MRFAPAAAALSLVLAVTGSVGAMAQKEADPRAAMLIAEGRAALENGETQTAIDAFEAALTIDPAYTPLFLELGKAARADKLQGKAIRYYREVLARDPGNLDAISGEGSALAEKGALDQAAQTLTKLEALCGQSCPETQRLAMSLEAARAKPVQTAEATTPESNTPQTN